MPLNFYNFLRFNFNHSVACLPKFYHLLFLPKIINVGAALLFPLSEFLWLLPVVVVAAAAVDVPTF